MTVNDSTYWIVLRAAARQKLMLNLSGYFPMNRIPIAPQMYRALKPFSSATVRSYELSQCCQGASVPNVHQHAIIKHTQEGGESIFNVALCMHCGASCFSEDILALSSSWTFTCLKACLHRFPFPKLTWLQGCFEHSSWLNSRYRFGEVKSLQYRMNRVYIEIKR